MTYQRENFEEVREKKLVQDMDEEIKAIEKKKTWDVVDLPVKKKKKKHLLGLNGFTRQRSMIKVRLKSLKQGWFPKDLFNNLVLIMERHFL